MSLSLYLLPFCLVIHSLSLFTGSHFGDTLSFHSPSDVQTITTSLEENEKLTGERIGHFRCCYLHLQETPGDLSTEI